MYHLRTKGLETKGFRGRERNEVLRRIGKNVEESTTYDYDDYDGDVNCQIFNEVPRKLVSHQTRLRTAEQAAGEKRESIRRAYATARRRHTRRRFSDS